MRLSPAVYGHFLRSLSQLAEGKVVAMLEGGYFVESLADGVALSVRSLMGGTAVRLGNNCLKQDLMKKPPSNC